MSSLPPPEPAAASRLPILGVMGSGSERCPSSWVARAEALGALVATLGCHLLTGGGRGLMAATARAFVAVRPRRGLSIGVLPADAERPGRPAPGYPNPWVEIAIHTHLAQRGAGGACEHSRNHLNVLSAAAILVLPGGPGTASEAELALRYSRPALGWLVGADELAPRPAGLRTVASIAEIEDWLRAVLGC